jgi:GR25 family glycosyltransferase involved in LPS biosynthesis
MFKVYSFSFMNPERKAQMDARFGSLGLPIHWVEPVLTTDPRIAASEPGKRAHAIMLNHLDMIRTFLASDVEFGVFCEDDIHIRRSFQKDIQVAIDGYKRLNLSVLLLGYLTNYRVADTRIHGYHSALETPFVFTNVHKDLWGSQMYMLSREKAAECLALFEDAAKVAGPYSPDWTITKMAGGACLYPMLAVETGAVQTDHWGQQQFHKACFETNYCESDYF